MTLAHGRTGTKSINKALNKMVASEPVTPVAGTASQGTLTIAEPVTVGDSITIGSETYEFVEGATSAAGEIGLGASEAETKLAIVAAINGTDTFNEAHPGVTAADFVGDDCVLTASDVGASGDGIAIESDFTNMANMFDGETLGTTTAGADATEGEAGAIRFDETNLYICTAKGTWRKIAHSAL